MRNTRTATFIVSLICWLLASALLAFIIAGIRDRARLISDNDNERIFNTLSMIRSSKTIAEQIESNVLLKERIIAFGVYNNSGEIKYAWGHTPAHFDEQLIVNQPNSRFGRYTIPDPKGETFKFVLHSKQRNRDRPSPSEPVFSTFLSGGNYVYIVVSHQKYWRTQKVTGFLFPLCEIALLSLVLYIRHLYLRNREYRSSIEAQKNLVVLGTAASTLAHEIKNPLLSIRIQTGILRKILHETGREEIAIIEEEIERLQSLTYRVNDYLREPKGNAEPLNIYNLLSESAFRLCGRSILTPESDKTGIIFMDRERARSVFENILRNALESGSENSAINASIARINTKISITMCDRGTGIDETDAKRLFDPFFTRKSTGTGIGLSISRRFVEAAGGSITLENRPGGGTVVRILIPEWETEKLDRGLSPLSHYSVKKY